MIEAAKIIGAGLATTRLVGAVVNIGALIVAVCLVLEIITGVTLAMHYNLISILSTITCLVMWTNILYVYYRIYNIGWIMISIVRKNTSNRSPIIHKYLNHSRLIELIWTITPALIIILIAFPSFKLLYLMNEVSDPAMSVSAEGHQWYWSYQYPDFLNANVEFIELDTYLVPELDSNSLNAENGNNFNEGGGNPNPQGSNHDPQGSDPNPEGSDPNPQGSNPNTFKGKGKEIEVDDTDTSKGKGKEVDEFESFRDPPQGETTTAELRNPNAKDYDPKYHGGRKVLKQYDDKGNVLPGGRQPYTDKQGRPILAPIRTLSREWIFYSNAVEPTTIVSPPNLKDILGKK